MSEVIIIATVGIVDTVAIIIADTAVITIVMAIIAAVIDIIVDIAVDIAVATMAPAAPSSARSPVACSATKLVEDQAVTAGAMVQRAPSSAQA